MHLKDLGNLTSAISSFVKTGSLAGHVNNVLAVSFKDLNAAQILEKVSILELTDAEKLDLISKYATDKATHNNIASIETLSVSQKRASASTLGLGGAFTGLGVSIKQTTISMVKFLTQTPAGWATLAIAAFAAVVAISDKLNESLEETKGRLSNLQSEIQDSTQKVSSLTTELESVRAKIEEINSLNGAQTTKDGELKELLLQEASLERQIALEKERQALSTEEATEAAEKVLSSTSQSEITPTVKKTVDVYDRTNTATPTEMDVANMLTPTELLREAVDETTRLEAELNSLIETKEEVKKTNGEESDKYKQLVNDIGKVSDAQNKSRGIAVEQGKVIEDTIKGIDKSSETYKTGSDALDYYSNSLLAAKNATGKLNEEPDASIKKGPFSFTEENNKAIDNYQNKINSLGNALSSLKEGKTVNLTDLIQEFPELANRSTSLDNAIRSLISNSLNDILSLLGDNPPENLKNSLQALADQAQGITKPLDEAFSAIQKSYDVLKDFKGAMSDKGLTDSILSSVGSLSGALNELVAGFYGGTVEADELYAALSDHYNTDLEYYGNALISKNLLSNEFYNAVGLGDKEVIDSFADNYGVDISNCKNYNQAKIAIEQQTLDTIGEMWKIYYNAQSKSLTNAGQELEDDVLSGAAINDPAAMELYNKLHEQTKAYEDAMNALDQITYDKVGADFSKISSDFGKKSSGKDTKEKAPTTKDFDWISRRQDLLQKLHNQEIEDADDEAKSYETRIALIDDLITKDNERLEFNKKAAETYTNAWEDAQAKILEEAAKQGEDGHAMIQNIMEGNDANQTITDKADQNLIEAIEAGIDAQDNLNAIQEKSEETNKEITEHLEKQKELKLALVQAQIDIVKAEMDGLDAEIQLMEASGKVVGEKQLKKQIRLSEDLAENYYDRISTLEDQLIDADENSAEYHSLMSEIYQCEAAIAECAVQQAEWNDQIKRLPIERINKFLELLDFVKEDLQNFIDQQNALGKTTSLPQFQELININLKQLEQLLDQQGKLAALLNDYEYGSEKYQETASDLQDIDNEISSLIQSQTEWNKSILQIPLDSISKITDTLQNAVSTMSNLLSDYDTAISAVTNVLDKQINSINVLKDAASDEYETKIKPFQDELDLLQKQNDARRIQLDLEQAAYDLARAQDQKTNKVIRDGEITYEADEEAIRSAQNAKNDADYNKVVHDLEAQISGLEEERDKLLEGYDLQIEKLDEIKDRWSSITEEIKLASDSLKADDVLGSGWQDKILSGSDAGIFNSIKDLYTTISDQKNQYEQQIASNERITDMMNQFMESWQNGSITYDQAMAGIKDLAIQMKDGYSSLEHLDALMNLNGATDLGTLLSQMQNSADASVNQFEDYMKVVKENADALEKYNSSWEEMQQNIRDQIAALEKLAKEAEKAADTIERHSSSSGSGGGSKGPNTSDNTYVKNGPGHTEEKLADAIANGKEIREYHKGGVVGGVKTTADLKNDEVFAKLEIGERVITHDQQEAYKATLRQLLEGNYSPAMSVMPMHDMMPVEKYESGPAEVNINMGDITLPNVTNVDEFVHDFGQHIDPMLSQAFSKVFR